MEAGDSQVEVFVSYKREDRDRVAPLVACLREAGLHVWWDEDLPGGAPWRSTLLHHLDAARCVIVIWSEASVSPSGDFVHEEASRAKQRGVLLPVNIDAVAPPLGFGQVQALDLTGWRGDSSDVRVKNVVTAARAIGKGAPRPAPAAVRRWQWAGVVAIAVSGLSLAADVASMQSLVCAAPGVHLACGVFGIGGVATRSEREEWAARPAGDCDWLRAFAARHPRGAYADEIDRMLRPRTVVDETWQQEDRTEPIYVTANLMPRATIEAARAEALSRGGEQAALACRGFNGGEFRLRSTRVDPASIQWQCVPTSGGIRCSFSADAVCTVEARHSTSREVCN